MKYFHIRTLVGTDAEISASLAAGGQELVQRRHSRILATVAVERVEYGSSGDPALAFGVSLCSREDTPSRMVGRQYASKYLNAMLGRLDDHRERGNWEESPGLGQQDVVHHAFIIPPLKTLTQAALTEFFLTRKAPNWSLYMGKSPFDTIEYIARASVEMLCPEHSQS